MTFLKRRTEPKPEVRRDPYRHIYQSARWHRFSKNYIKANPLCNTCLKEGKTESSEVTDHIVPLVIWIPQGGDPYDLTNLQPLSKVCHNRKTAEDNKGWNKHANQ